jgi:hypothetical protein
MTLPAFANPWNFLCGYTGPCDRDPIRAVGTDETATVWVMLQVPPILARGLANRWSGEKGFIEVSTERAAAFLANDVWADLNREIAERLLPPKPKATPEPVQAPEAQESEQEVTKEMIADAIEFGRAARPLIIRMKKRRTEAALKRDPARSDYAIGIEAHTSRSFVTKVRRQMVEAGELKDVPLQERVPRQRPKRYRRWFEQVPPRGTCTKSTRHHSRR